MIVPFDSIVVDKHEERKFRRRALRKLPREFIEALWGYARGDTLYICVFMPLTHKAKKRDLDYDDDELDFQEDEALEYKLEFLGTIHTHAPNSDGESVADLSATDIHYAQDNQEAVMGVCAISKENGKRKCTIKFWPKTLPLKISYRNLRTKVVKQSGGPT